MMALARSAGWRSVTSAGSLAPIGIDVSHLDVDPGPDLPRDRAMGRFHVRLPSGELRSGGAALVEIWNVLPLHRPAGLFARLPGVTPALDIGYELASPLRPLAARLLRHVS